MLHDGQNVAALMSHGKEKRHCAGAGGHMAILQAGVYTVLLTCRSDCSEVVLGGEFVVM